MDQEFRFVPTAELRESKTNPRRRFDEQGLEELVESVRSHGVLVPLLVRSAANGKAAFEIIAGARRFRAATKAKLEQLPVRVCEMDDAHVLEVQVIENLQREDVHPLDEALGYQALIKAAQYDVAAIAAKVGKSESYIYQRLKLAELVPAAQKLFLEQTITAGHAILIARLQPADQKRALEYSVRDRWIGGDGRAKLACSVRELGNWIQEEIHLDLNAVPFSKDDAHLVAAAGPCTTCPKRTGFTPALFADIAKKDTCTDPSCFKAKLDAWSARRKKELAAEGRELVQVSEGYGRTPKGAIRTNDWQEIKAKTKACDATKDALIVDGERQGRLVRACTDPRCKVHHPYAARSSGASAADRAREEKVRIARKIRDQVLEGVRAKVPKKLGRPELELVALGFWADIWHENRKRICKLHGWDAPKKQYGGGDFEKAGAHEIPKLSDPALSQVLIELAVSREMEVHPYSPNQPTKLLALAKRYRVNVAAIERTVRREAAEAKKARAKKRPKDKRKKIAAAADPACEVCKCTEYAACPEGCAWDPTYKKAGRFVCTSCSDEARPITSSRRVETSAAAEASA